MSPRAERRALAALLVAVAGLEAALLLAWGDRPPIFDEEGYRKAGEALAGWLRAGLPTGDLEGPGRVAWHNPGYGLLAAMAALLPGPAAVWLRALQAGAHLLSGILLARYLTPRVGGRLAAIGAAVFWLHPTALFFNLTLWPASLATLGASALLYAAGRWQRAPDDPARQLEVGVVLAILPFFAASAVFLLPLAAVVSGRGRRRRILGPAVLALGAWSLALSLALGTFVPLDLAGPRNLALGNSEWVRDGRGSLWGDREAKAQLLDALGEACGAAADRARMRCEAQWSTDEARTWARAHPREALQRAGLRVIETWGPDDFLPRHLADADAFPPAGLPRTAAGARRVLVVLHAGVLLALIAVVLGGRRRRDLRVLATAIALWTLPAALSVGMTRLRQPTWVWIVAGGVVAWKAAGDIRGRRSG